MSLRKQRILITNDDGIHAPGIAVLEEIARTITDDVWVVAPGHEQSGAGHSVSLTTPIRMRRLDDRHFQIDGTPTDCVLMAVSQCMTAGPPTMVLSGINSGANLAEDVSYSGTIAAAMEGTLLGIRSIALSQVRALDGQADFGAAARHAPALLEKLIALDEWPPGSFINVNFPNVPADAVTGVRLTTQGQRPPGTFSIDARVDARQQPYYWVKITYAAGNELPDTDLEAIAAGAVSVTPIKMDFTDYAWGQRLAALVG
jgi:5'-nucleotidase